MKFLTTDYSHPVSESHHYRIDTARGMRIEEYQGKVGLGDMKSIVSAMASDPCWSPDHHGLVDFSEAELEMSANDVLRLALMLRQEDNRSHGWMVFVVRSSVAYGVVRMLGYWSRNTERFRIFQSREEAEAWLEGHLDQAPPGFREPSVAPKEAAIRHVV
jgi:hypothetical protein